MFLPSTPEELRVLNWDRLDVILVAGDAYIDSPYIGVSVIGKVLTDAGFRVGVIAQPDIDTEQDISRFGEPILFWGVTAGCVDSMVANYTAVQKRRKSDDFTPGGVNNRRPDRASIVYSNLIRRSFKDTKPIVLGGIEASLRRIPHYDYWSDKIRKSILFDAKADYLIYGMGEKAAVEFAESLRSNGDPSDIKGLCYISKNPPGNYVELPSFDDVKGNYGNFIKMFRTFYDNSDPTAAKGLCQGHDARYLVHNPPMDLLTSEELDYIYELPYEQDVHPMYKSQGKIKALDTIQFSITTHRGCYGECNFCGIAVHQGKTVFSRTEESIIREAEGFVGRPAFKGIIRDAGGPTANMYGFECERKLERGCSEKRRCLYPKTCQKLKPSHRRQIELLRKIRRIKGVKKVFIASGVRTDLVLADKEYGDAYIEELVNHHVSGQMKLAPEHSEKSVLKLMGKSGIESVLYFRKRFTELTRKAGKKQFLTYYLIAAHPGGGEEEMKRLRKFATAKLRLIPEQVQIFTPLPSTWSSVMYYTGINPFTGEIIFVEKDNRKKERQKNIVTGK